MKMDLQIKGKRRVRSETTLIYPCGTKEKERQKSRTKLAEQ